MKGFWRGRVGDSYMRKNKNRCPKALLLLLLVLGLTACQTNKSDGEGSADDIQIIVVEALGNMDAIISQSSLEEESLKDTPWISSKVDVEGLDGPVSMNVVREYMNTYRYYTGDELTNTPEDFVSLVNDEDEEVFQSFEDYLKWLGNNGYAKVNMYRDNVRSAYRAYQANEGSNFNDKELGDLSAQDNYDLAIWAKDNPDAGEGLEERDKENFENLVKSFESN